jgi:putative methyltransferase (TIGR04325 family)
MSSYARELLKPTVNFVRHSVAPLRAIGGRLRYLSPFPRRFTGAYSSYEQAYSKAQSLGLAGYDHEEVADIALAQMSLVAPWDYPVLFWLRPLMGELDGLVDAGGHVGTKYRAWRDLLPIGSSFRWSVYDLPAIARVGARMAERDGLDQLSFFDRIEEAPASPLFLGSGLMQYLDTPLSALLRRMPRLPTHLILNKVALRKGAPVVTLERIGRSYVPYQVRSEGTFIEDIQAMGYSMIDRWTIPSLSNVIETHPELGASTSSGFYFRWSQPLLCLIAAYMAPLDTFTDFMFG